MRRAVFAILGGMELVVAIVLIVFGMTLPSREQVQDGFDRIEATSRRAGKQVSTVRRQVVEVRRPELQQLADRLQNQTQTVARTVRGQRVDFDTVATLRDSLREVARGIDATAETIDPDRVARLGQGLGDTARYLDDKLLPAAGRAADQLDEVAAALGKDAAALAKLLADAPPDLKAARDVHDSLGRFDEGLDRMMKLIELKRLDAIKQGFAGMEQSLETTAGEVERLAGYKYPNIKVRGLRVEVEERPFWPNGERVAEGLRKATEGVRAAQQELDGVAKEMPSIRTSLEESRKVVARTRDAIGKTLAQQDRLDPLLRDIPRRAGALAETLPKLATELAKVLRETRHLRTISTGFKQAQSNIETVVKHWPELRTSLTQTAKVLRGSSQQLDQLLTHREEYEASVRQSTEMAETFAQMVPLITNQLTAQLQEQERSLTDLEHSLDDASDTVPQFKQNALDMLRMSRILIFLVASIVTLHGGFILIENLRPRPPSDSPPAR